MNSALITLHQIRRDSKKRNCGSPHEYHSSSQDYETAIMAIRSATRIVIDISTRFLTDLAFIDLPSLPLPATFTVYQAALLHIDFAGPNIRDPAWIQDYNALKGSLAHFGRRWDVGRKYLEYLDSAYTEALQANARGNG